VSSIGIHAQRRTVAILAERVKTIVTASNALIDSVTSHPGCRAPVDKEIDVVLKKWETELSSKVEDNEGLFSVFGCLFEGEHEIASSG
jgi:hypothetical protein